MESNTYFHLQLTVGLKGVKGSQGTHGPPGRRVSISMRTKSHVLLVSRMYNGKGIEFKVRSTGFKSKFCLLLAVCPSASHGVAQFTSKAEMTYPMLTTSNGSWEDHIIKQLNYKVNANISGYCSFILFFTDVLKIRMGYISFIKFHPAGQVDIVSPNH